MNVSTAKDHAEVAVVLTSLGTVYGTLGNPEQQKQYLEHALKIKERVHGPDHSNVAVTLMNLSNAYSKLGEVEKEKKCLLRALSIKQREFGSEHPKLAPTLVNLAQRRPCAGKGFSGASVPNQGEAVWAQSSGGRLDTGKLGLLPW